MSSLLIVCVLHLVVILAATAQSDRPASPDSIDDEVRFGQPGDAEGSPLAEILEPEKAAAPLFELRSRFMERTEPSEGYRSGYYAGSRLRSYQRLRIAPAPHVSGGVLLEKDPGERRLDDFATGYVALRALGPVRTLLLGDFTVESGLGLSLWRGADVGKGEDVAGAVVREARGIVPHLSSDENAYLRGAALGMRWGRWTLDLFSSFRRVDATVNGAGEVTGLYSAGYFRAAGEESKRGRLGEALYGGTLHYESQPGTGLGFGFYRSRFARRLLFDGGLRFSGRSADVVSCDYRWKAGPWSLFGEWGLANGVPGGSSGVRLRPASGIDLVTAARWYPYRFVSLHGNGFGAQGEMSNEHGIYLGMRLSPVRFWTVAVYVDAFRLPGGTPSHHFASGGSDRFLQLELHPAARCAVTLRYARKEAPGEALTLDAAGLARATSAPSLRRSLRLTAEYRTGAGLRIRGRWERTEAAADGSGSASRGMLVLAELTAPSAPRFWWHVRLVLFRTTAYEARIYAYERDLEGVTAMPAIYGEGFRWSCVLRYRVSTAFACSVKYSVVSRDDVRRIGTGPDRLSGNDDAAAGVQFDLAW